MSLKSAIDLQNTSLIREQVDDVINRHHWQGTLLVQDLTPYHFWTYRFKGREGK